MENKEIKFLERIISNLAELREMRKGAFTKDCEKLSKVIVLLEKLVK